MRRVLIQQTTFDCAVWQLMGQVFVRTNGDIYMVRDRVRDRVVQQELVHLDSSHWYVRACSYSKRELRSQQRQKCVSCRTRQQRQIYSTANISDTISVQTKNVNTLFSLMNLSIDRHGEQCGPWWSIPCIIYSNSGQPLHRHAATTQICYKQTSARITTVSNQRRRPSVHGNSWLSESKARNEYIFNDDTVMDIFQNFKSGGCIVALYSKFQYWCGECTYNFVEHAGSAVFIFRLGAVRTAIAHLVVFDALEGTVLVRRWTANQSLTTNSRWAC